MCTKSVSPFVCVIKENMLEKNKNRQPSLASVLLKVDYLDGQLPKYERDVSAKSFYISNRGSVPVAEIELQEFTLPTFEIASNPVWHQNYPERAGVAIEKGYESLSRHESMQAVALLSCSAPKENILVVEEINFNDILFGFGLIESHELEVEAILCHPMVFRHLCDRPHKFFYMYDKNTFKRIYENKNNSFKARAVFSGAPIYVSALVPKNELFVLAAPEYIGVLAIKKDITETQADDPRKLKSGVVLCEEIGISVIYDYAVAKIQKLTQSDLNTVEGVGDFKLEDPEIVEPIILL